MTVENISRIDPGWTDYHGFESPLLQDWAASGPFGARLLGITLPKVMLDSRVGPLARRLEGGAFAFDATGIEREAPLTRRLSERAPDRLPLTRSDESRRLERTRLVLMDVGFVDEDRTMRQERRAA